MNKFFNWLFGNQQQKPVVKTQQMVNTAPLSEQQIQSILHNNNPRFELQQLIASCGQSVGKQRELNEDSLFALTATMAGNSGNLPFGLYIVADGMGGHQFGEVASNAAIRSVAGYVTQQISSLSLPDQPRTDGGIISGDHAGCRPGSPARHSKGGARQRDHTDRRAGGRTADHGRPCRRQPRLFHSSRMDASSRSPAITPWSNAWKSWGISRLRKQQIIPIVMCCTGPSGRARSWIRIFSPLDFPKLDT